MRYAWISTTSLNSINWQWVSYWYPLNQVISFKREVYRRAMKELALPLGRHTDTRRSAN